MSDVSSSYASMFPLIGEKASLHISEAKDLELFVQLEIENFPFVKNESYDRHLALLSDPDCLHLSVYTTENMKFTGHVLLFGIANRKGVIELRRIVINDKKKGYGREAIQRIIKFCFEGMTANEIWLDVYADNEKAIRLYESEGFRKKKMNLKSTHTDASGRSFFIYGLKALTIQ